MTSKEMTCMNTVTTDLGRGLHQAIKGAAAQVGVKMEDVILVALSCYMDDWKREVEHWEEDKNGMRAEETRRRWDRVGP